MSSHSLTSALTLYRSGTLTLTQAAAHCGRSETEFQLAAAGHGAERRESVAGDRDPATPARAD
ncbi:hypothetical protein [Candidatus Halobonum tyrrellensis]|uniref:Uncharacterized protein n=1 Tax=Candidatus Halobonum tyrrellensis G22 TaxID=1324957 RepID=V4GRR9_9EURY|nr:hypothetical protein [Candidatus Halobonum tyrrellensis]ESP87751.1 hypothetical protein K933_12538 [Candidatus Halobonum tyrrellensis G22]